MSNAGNVAGGIVRNVTPEQEMGAFDLLPDRLRATLREARLEFPSGAVLAAVLRGRPASAIAAEIEAVDRRMSEGRHG